MSPPTHLPSLGRHGRNGYGWGGGRHWAEKKHNSGLYISGRHAGYEVKDMEEVINKLNQGRTE